MTGRLTDELKACIGKQESFTTPEELGSAMLRLFAIATADTNPLFIDEAAAAQSYHGGIIAPPTFVCETNQMYPVEPGESGYFGHRWDLPLTVKKAMRGGNRYEFHKPVRPTDRVTATWRITDIFEKETRKEGSLIFIISEVRYTNQHNELLAVNYETTIQ